MNTELLKERILQDANEVSRLHTAVHETFKHRDENNESRKVWENACKEFNSRYDQLAFPDGYEGALDRIITGDPLAMEAAICFLELRPFFFRSGYMFKDILRKCRKAPLSEEQSSRLKAVEIAVANWRNEKSRHTEGSIK